MRAQLAMVIASICIPIRMLLDDLVDRGRMRMRRMMGVFVEEVDQEARIGRKMEKWQRNASVR